jgi:RNA polymerase subunit RPABC4/transcription elongation factor Spt4
MSEPKKCSRCKEYFYDGEKECPYCGNELSEVVDNPRGEGNDRHD